MRPKLILALVLIPSLAWAQTPERVLDKALIAKRTAGFASHLRHLGFSGRLRACRNMMEVAVGVRGGNLSYGAVCEIVVNGKASNVLLCDDNMVGHFALNGGSFGMSEDSVAEFTKQNCYGG